MMLPWQKRPLALNSPRDLPGLALWLDSKDVSSLRNDAGAQPVTTDGIKLASDKSGNSSTNVLCLNGVAGNYASAPDSVALSGTAGREVIVDLAANDYTPAAANVITGKWNGAGVRSWYVRIDVAGTITFFYSTDGTASGSITTTTGTGVTDLAQSRLRIVFVGNDGSGNRVLKAYKSDYGTGANESQIGTTVTTAGAVTIFDSTAIQEIGTVDAGLSLPFAGTIGRLIIRNTEGGANVFDANFALPAKLAPSFTESSSNAATVTINTSGATGARISGARDLYQGTAANQPILTIAAAGNYLTFDGSNDYLKAAAFALAQPETVYFVGSQVTWTLNEAIYDGNGVEVMELFQNGATASPDIAIYAGSVAGNNSALSLGARGIITAVFNGASSSTRVNRLTAATGNAGALAANGFTLGARGNAAVPANITAQEVVVYSGAHDKATQERVIAMLARNNRIALT